jgi:MFS family permease
LPSNQQFGVHQSLESFSPRALNIAIKAFSLISIFSGGYDQGVMDGIIASPYYVTKTTTLGGTVSIYLGCIFGCFVGGWAADRIACINGIFYACFFAVIGGALQAITQNLEFIWLLGASLVLERVL